MARRHRLERVQVVPAARTQVFEFFSAVENLQRLTPPSLSFRILTPLPIVLDRGRLIEYRMGIAGIPLRWQSEITLWQPNERFVDVQLRGPYRYWHHLHEFSDVAGGTEIRDVVDYELPLGPLGAAAHALFAKRLLARVFAFRFEAVAAAFSASETAGLEARLATESG